MTRVYLDWNIFSYLKQHKETREPYMSLNDNLTRNTDKILIPYSSAHLTDLVNGDNQSEKARKEIESDLVYLANLTHHQCILYDYKNKRTYPDVYDIHDYYSQLKESKHLGTGNLEQLFPSDSGESSIQSAFIDLLKTLPTGIDFTKFNGIPSQLDTFKTIFQKTKEENTFYNLLSDTTNLISEYNNNPKTYSGLRNNSLKVLEMDYDYTNDETPILTINDRLVASKLNKSFDDFVNENLRDTKDSPSTFDVFTKSYLMLDYFGYYRDKKFRNLVQDSFHAYYGAFCDFFITDDDNTFHKAKALYKHFNIETIVCKSSDFNSKFYGKIILHSYTGKGLLDTIADTINSSLVSVTQHDSDFNPVDIYKIDHYILNYFNRLQITHNNDGSNCIYLYKNSKNYSSFYFWKEIEVLVTNITKEFGGDINNMSTYLPEIENEELLTNSWRGRKWMLRNAIIELKMNNAPFLLTLELTLKGRNCV